MKLALASLVAALALGVVGNLHMESEYVSEAIEKEMRVVRAEQVYRELRCDCSKLNARREWLYYQIANKPDSKGCTIFCQYGKPQLIAENL